MTLIKVKDYRHGIKAPAVRKAFTRLMIAWHGTAAVMDEAYDIGILETFHKQAAADSNFNQTKEDTAHDDRQ